MRGHLGLRNGLFLGVLGAAFVWAGPLAEPPGHAAPAGPAVRQEAEGGQRGRGFGGGPQVQPVEPLRFEYMGPPAGGRVASVVGIAGDPNTYYLGSASGGVWKSTDGGNTFEPIFDQEDTSAIGSLAVAPSNPNIVWAGTGEAWVIRDSDIIGDGIYKSTDAGKTWQHMGLEKTGRIGRIIVNPTNPNIVFACAIGRVTGEQQERGVFRTTDGGATWLKVLFVDPKTGCSGLSMDAHDPNTLFAGTWEVTMHTWGEYSGGPGSGVYVSHDNGTSWNKITTGLPRPPYGKVDVAVAPSDSKRVYALIQTADQGSLWRSDDGGATFTVVSWDRTLIGRAGYYIRIAVNPQDADDVFVLNSGFHRSYDGGATFGGRGGAGRGAPAAAGGRGGAAAAGRGGAAGGGGFGGGGGASCGDCHDVWIDPQHPDRYVLTDDGGANISTGQGGTIRVSLPNAQNYHVAVDNRVPYWIYSNRQDDGTMRGPSTVVAETGNGRLPESAPAAAAGGRGGRGGFGGGRGGRGGGGLAWEANLGGCESGFTIPDPTDADIVWATCYGNKLTRWDAREGTARSVSPWMITLDSPPDKGKYRCHWTAPLAIDPLNHNNVYYGCQVVFKTSNGGQAWTVISPDLSTRDPSKIVSSGGIVGDNLGQFEGEVVFAIAPSPVQEGLIWAGTNDGKLWYTKDGGGTWVDVTKNIPGLPVWGTFSKIEPSTFDAGTAYVAVDAHLMDNLKPYIYKTTDYGQTWTSVTGDLPSSDPLDYVKAVTENPNKRGMLFAGTGHAFYYSMDDGAHWARFREGLPPSPVTWIVVEPRYHDVVVSTYGRGLYILKDITVLEQTGQTTPPPATRLYTPRVGIRQARSGSAEFLLSLASAPSAPVDMEIRDAGGQLVRSEQVQAREGLNRLTWNLQYDPPQLVVLRTTPPQNPHIWDEPRFQGRDTRTITHWGVGPGTATPIAAPGKYTVALKVDGQTLSAPFEVIKDPAIISSDADLVESTKMQVRIRDDLTATSEMVNRMEVSRRQIEDLLKANQGKDELEKPLMDLNQKILNVELQLVTKEDMTSDDKYFVEAYKVYMNLLWFGGAVGTGASDEAGSADYKPRDAAYQILDNIEHDLAAAKADFTTLVNTDIPAFNKTMAGKLPPIK
jgi:photosystem II stability/assembly factor-like uncharacterized protein